MKWLFLAVLLGLVAPLSGWLRRNPSEAPKIWLLMGFMPVFLTLGHFNTAPISWGDWPGYAKGMELTVFDVLAAAVYFSLPRDKLHLPFCLSMFLYFLSTLLSAVQAEVPMAAGFYSWQLARMFLVYAVVAKGCADKRNVPYLLMGMAAGLFLEAGIAAWQRFGQGILQAPGTFGHQNLLGLVMHLVVLPFFALALTGRSGWLCGAVVAAGLVLQVSTASRATIGLAAAGYLVVFVLSGFRQWTSWKALVLLAGGLLVGVVAPIALSGLQHRMEAMEASDQDYDERAAFERAAGMMLSDRPFGVGPNNYVIVANVNGYNARAGVATQSGSEGAHVHNIYRLVGAESGYLGLITFILMLLHPLPSIFAGWWRLRGDDRGDLLLGIGVGLVTVYVHSLYEWSLATATAQYMLAITLGLVAGVLQQVRNDQLALVTTGPEAISGHVKAAMQLRGRHKDIVRT